MSCPCTAELNRGSTEVFRGDTANWTFTFYDADCDPIDVTGWMFYLVLRDGVDEASSSICQIITSTAPDNETSQAGQATITLHSTVSKELPAQRYYYEFKRVLPNTDPVDIWTFYGDTKPTFEVKEGTPLHEYL